MIPHMNQVDCPNWIFDKGFEEWFCNCKQIGKGDTMKEEYYCNTCREYQRLKDDSTKR